MTYLRINVVWLFVCILTAEWKVSFNFEGVPGSISAVRGVRETNLSFLPDSGACWTHHHTATQPGNVPGQYRPLGEKDYWTMKNTVWWSSNDLTNNKCLSSVIPQGFSREKVPGYICVELISVFISILFIFGRSYKLSSRPVSVVFVLWSAVTCPYRGRCAVRNLYTILTCRSCRTE